MQTMRLECKQMTEYSPIVDEALDRVLKASGSALKHYTTPATLERMREAMRKVMSEQYIIGSNDCHDVLTGKKRGRSRGGF